MVRSNIHRVIGPPGEQEGLMRYSLVYFSRPEMDVQLKALKESPVIHDQAVKEEGKYDDGISSADVLKRMFGGLDGPRGRMGLKGWAVGFA
jgi:isopenicillin N synthase-like dioxygenase